MHMRHAKRQQNTDITVIPSVSGVSGYKTAGDPSATQLVVGTNSDSTSSETDAPDFAPGTSLVVTSTSTTSSPSQTPSETAVLSGAKSVISLSTVVGVCIGAFVGAGLLICLSVWFYRRSSRRPPPRRTRQQPLAQSHGIDPATPWTRFDDGEDKWDGRNEMRERKAPTNIVIPSATLRATSPHSAEKTLTSEDHFAIERDVAGDSLPFSQYHPKLPNHMVLEPPRPIGVENQSTASLDSSTAGTFLSLGTVHIESGKMSPTFNMAKMTPPATASKLHRWESAEVINPDEDGQEVEIHHDPFSEKSTPTTYSPTETFGEKKGFQNPFFNAHPATTSRRPSTTRKHLTMSVSSDPFNKDEIEVMAMPKPKFVSHTAQDSSSSSGSVGNGKAMQNLIAALELPQEVIEERLRVASMNPSEASRYSTVLDGPVGYAVPVPEEQGYLVQ